MIIVVTEYETITFHISATLLPKNPLDKPLSILTSNLFEILIVLLIFGFIDYMTFEPFVENAKDFAKYIVILIIFFIITLMIL